MVAKEFAKHCSEADRNFNWDQKKEIPYMVPEMWLPNLR